MESFITVPLPPKKKGIDLYLYLTVIYKLIFLFLSRLINNKILI